eukprot:5093290-Amphidinium_carterae.1
MCEDLARSLTPSKQGETVQTTTEAIISIATLPTSQPAMNHHTIAQIQGASPSTIPQAMNRNATAETQGQQLQQADDIKLPTVTTYSATPKYKAAPTGDTQSAIHQAISSQRPVCARYKQPPAGTIPVELKTGVATTHPVCKQPPATVGIPSAPHAPQEEVAEVYYSTMQVGEVPDPSTSSYTIVNPP